LTIQSMLEYSQRIITTNHYIGHTNMQCWAEPVPPTLSQTTVKSCRTTSVTYNLLIYCQIKMSSKD
jgi:hypothetical protein